MQIDVLTKRKEKFLLLIIFLVSCLFKINAQDSTQAKLIEDGKLKWSDYTGEIDSSSNYWATTNWYVQYKYSINHIKKDTVVLDLRVWPLLKRNSWVLADKETNELLAHEQGHFDFARLLAAEFKKETSSATFLLNDYRYKLDSIFNALLKKISEMETQYDIDTNHMWNKQEQKQWNKKISDMLKAAE